MPKFQVGRELNSLSRRDIAVGDKDHVCDRSTRKDGSTHELTNKIYTAVLVRDSHDDTDGNEENRADAKSKK